MGDFPTGTLRRLRLPFSSRRRPPTMPSRAAEFLRRWRDPRPPLHVLHIGKTGGTALKHTLLEHLGEANHRLLLHGHDVTVADIPRGEHFMFVVRDPVSRFVSAFNSRLRRGWPRYDYPWTEGERAAFARFKTPEELASALSAEGPVRAEAEQAMAAIGHLQTSYSYWLGDEEALLRRRTDLFFVGFQERLDDDFELLKHKLDLPGDAHLPADDVTAYRAPRDAEAELSAAGRANLEQWYARDRRLVAVCADLAAEPAVQRPPQRARSTRPALWVGIGAAALVAWLTKLALAERYNPLFHRVAGGWSWLLLAPLCIAVVWLAAAGVLFVAGRTDDARALAGFLPDCLVLGGRLLADGRVAARHKVLLVLLLAYLAMPVDPIPDFIPILGQLDDALLAMLVLHLIVRAGGRPLIRQHWPGPDSSLRLLLRAGLA